MSLKNHYFLEHKRVRHDHLYNVIILINHATFQYDLSAHHSIFISKFSKHLRSTRTGFLFCSVTNPYCDFKI